MENSYKVGIIMPEFCDQRYLRDRDKTIIANSEEDAIKEYKNWAFTRFLNEDEIRAVRQGRIKIGLVK